MTKKRIERQNRTQTEREMPVSRAAFFNQFGKSRPLK